MALYQSVRSVKHTQNSFTRTVQAGENKVRDRSVSIGQESQDIFVKLFYRVLFVILTYSEKEPNDDDAQHTSEKTGPVKCTSIYKKKLNIILLRFIHGDEFVCFIFFLSSRMY